MIVTAILSDGRIELDNNLVETAIRPTAIGKPHEALGMKCPVEFFSVSPRQYQGTPADLEYPAMEARRVNHVGMIRWRKERVFITSALAGWSVGLAPCGPDHWEVWFGRLLLGHLEEQTGAFRHIDVELASSANSKRGNE